MACRLVGTKPLSEPMLEYFHLTLRNILQWNFNRNSDIFIQENAFESVICEMAAILSRPQCVNSLWCSYTTWHHLSGSSWVEKMTNHYPKQWWLLVKWVLRNQHQWKSSKQNIINFHLTKCIWKRSPAKCRPVFFCSGLDVLTHLPLDKMAVISQTIFSGAFSWMKNLVFWPKFHWSLFPWAQLIITQHWFR